MMRDPEFGMVRVRAFGTYSIKAADPAVLLRELVGTDPDFRTDEVDEFVRQSVVSRVVTALATSGVAALDLAAHQNEIADRLAVILSEDLNLIGLQMPRFVIENVSLPPEVEATMDKRTSMGVLGDLDQFTRYQAATAITEAAQNPGGWRGRALVSASAPPSARSSPSPFSLLPPRRKIRRLPRTHPRSRLCPPSRSDRRRCPEAPSGMSRRMTSRSARSPPRGSGARGVRSGQPRHLGMARRHGGLGPDA
jgi:hypothetical protein